MDHMNSVSPGMDRHGWLAWFQLNRDRQQPEIPHRALLPEDLAVPLVRALQVFQRGETGEARVVGELARSSHPAVDATLIAAFDLHLKEEGRHARELKAALASLGAPIVPHSRAEKLFRASRRAFGPIEEMVVLAVAEVVGMAFYRTLAERLPQQDLAHAMGLIARDEAAHLDFLCDFFTEAALRTPLRERAASIARWSALFLPGVEAGAVLVAIQHRALLHRLGTDGFTFRRRCQEIVTAQDAWSGKLRGPARALGEVAVQASHLGTGA